MFPLHSGHSGFESASILALALVAVAAAFALTREGWSRVGALLAVAAFAGGLRVAVEAVGLHAVHGLHLVGHGLEVGVVVLVALAGYYAVFDAAPSPTDA